MKNITIETNWVRVIRNTHSPDIKKLNEMIGQELEVDESDYGRDIITVWNKDKSDSWYFNKADVRFLTPMKWNESHIAIGDEVEAYSEWEKVLGYYIYGNEIKLLIGTPEDTYIRNISGITNHRTEQVEEMTLEQVCKELGKNVKIIK